MKYNKMLALIPALLLAACGGDDQVIHKKTIPGSVVYSYPADGQMGISPKADVVLRFSNAITEDESKLQGKIKLTSDGNDLPFTVTMVDGGKSLTLETNDNLAPATSYSITFSEPLQAKGDRAINTPNSVGDIGIQFTTRASFSGIAELAKTDDDFKIAWQVPAADSDNAKNTDLRFKAMNFSTFRLAMTQPVHPDWKALGGSIELLNKDGQPVPATVLVKGNRITVDPCVTEDPQLCGSKDDILNSGETYTLKLANLTSLVAASDAPHFTKELSYTPRDTGPTVVLKQSAVGSGLASGVADQNVIRSILNGQPINGVTLNSVLQGVAGPSQQTGDLFAELAFAPAFEADEALPLRIAKGSILQSTSLDVLVGGVVPVTEAVRSGEPTGALQTTGDIKVTMLSDASGYMSPNAYTDDINAPRHITLFMDVSMNTENAQPNAALSQDLMGVELRGIALVRDGVLTIDAIGMVEPNLLGQEYTDSTIAFHLEAATDADSALDAEQERLLELDNTGPKLVSWTPGAADAIPATRQSMQRPGDPVILFFDEPLDPASIDGSVTLRANGTPVTNLKTRLDGTALILTPEGGLEHGVNYKISANGLTDLAGNVTALAPLKFSLPKADDDSISVTPQSPFALTTYPGYPCVTTGLDLPNNKHGYCKDAAGENLPSDQNGNTQSRDILPVTTLPEDRPIVVVFSQSMDLASINHDTFIVERVDDNGAPLPENSIVEGRLEKSKQRIRFFPEIAWTPGQLYRYTLVSAKGGNCSSVICGENGRAFQTDLLVDPTDNGGEPLVIYFRGHESIASVFTPLRNLPIRDTNSNYAIENFETFEFEKAVDDNGVILDHFVTPPNAARLAMDGNATVLGNDGKPGDANARVGCSYEESQCWDNKFIYQTYGLNTEVVGPEINPETGEKTGNIRVLLYPTMLVTTPATVWYKMLSSPSESNTGPQILRMRYQEPTENNPLGLVEGLIIKGEDGGPRFKTTARLMLDAPNLHLPIEGLLAHNLFSYPFTLKLEGPITFFDDGRMQIEQRNSNTPLITVNVAGSSDAASGLLGFISCLGGIFTGGGLDACKELANGNGKAVQLPLKIPPRGVYLNFVTNPVKDLPAAQ